MEKSKAKKGLPVFIGVAAVWMGTHFDSTKQPFSACLM